MPVSYKAFVVGNDHYNTLNVIRALGMANIEIHSLIITDSNKSFVSKSRYIKFNHIVKSEEEAIDFLIEYGKGEKLNKKIPLITTYDGIAAKVDLRYNILIQWYYLPSVKGQQGLLLQEMSKKVQIQNAYKAGFDVPFTISLNLASLSNDYPENFNYFPCLIKPNESYKGSKSNFRICETKEEVMEAIRNLKGKINLVLLQQYIPNERVILLAGVRTLSGETYLSGEVDKFKFSKHSHNLGLNCLGVLNTESSLLDKCQRYVDLIDYHGCFSIDVVRTRRGEEEKNWFLEINLRTDGLLYFYNKAGINYPAIWIKSCYGEIPYHVKIQKAVIGMNEINYIKNCLSLESVKDFMKTKAFSLFDLKDLKPLIFKILNNG